MSEAKFGSSKCEFCNRQSVSFGHLGINYMDMFYKSVCVVCKNDKWAGSCCTMDFSICMSCKRDKKIDKIIESNDN